MHSRWLIITFLFFIGAICAIYTATHLSESTVLLFAFALVILNFASSAVFAKRSLDMNRDLEKKIKTRELQFVKQRESLSEYNTQLRKKLTVRSMYTNAIVHQAKKLSDQPAETSLSPELLKIKSQLETSFDSILALESECCDENGYLKVDLVSLMEAVINAWHAEFREVGVELQLAKETEEIFIKAKCFNIDDLLNRLLAHIYQCSYVEQKIEICIRQHKGRLAVCFVDGGWRSSEASQAKTNFRSEDSAQFIQKMVEDSGGRYQLMVTEKLNELIVSWNLWVTHENLVDCEEHDEWLNKVLYLIDQRFDDPDFSTSTASKCLFLSERSLQRKFKNLTQQTFTEYLTQVRLKNACQLLKEGHKVCDVALNSGFNDPSYFSQKFRTHFGVSPSKYTFSIMSEHQSNNLDQSA